MRSLVPIVLLALLPSVLSLYGPLEFGIGLSDNAKMYLMCEHNRYRSMVAKGQAISGTVQPKAANMQAMCWCEELVPKAQTHANNCGGPSHDDRSTRSTANFPDVGQSLMDTMPSSPLDEAMQAFSEETMGYNFTTNYCNTTLAGRAHVCGHYTALAWATTKCLGCAYNSCPGFANGRLVCNYGPGGNIGTQKPYVRGEPCTGCNSGQLCLDGSLCSDSMVCGDSNRCSPAPSGSSSSSSSSSCADLDSNCPAYKDYPSIRACDSTSPYLLYAQLNCKATCNWCGGVSSQMVCARNFNINSGLCQQLTAIDTKECIDGIGLRYAGTKSTTTSGHTCMAWSTNDPGTNYYADFEFPERSKAAAKNYCRNPASSGSKPWCYTTNPSVRWEYCSIPAC